MWNNSTGDATNSFGFDQENVELVCTKNAGEQGRKREFSVIEEKSLSRASH